MRVCLFVCLFVLSLFFHCSIFAYYPLFNFILPTSSSPCFYLFLFKNDLSIAISFPPLFKLKPFLSSSSSSSHRTSDLFIYFRSRGSNIRYFKVLSNNIERLRATPHSSIEKTESTKPTIVKFYLPPIRQKAN